MPYAALIDWVGPFASIAELRAAAADFGVGETLYLAIGSRPRQRQSHIQYVGITTDLGSRFNGKHPIQTLLKPSNLRLFIGIVTSQSVAGRKARHQPVRFSTPLYLAETALAFLMEIPLNKDKRCNPPKDSVVVVNRWYRTDFDTRRRRRPHPMWPDLVEFDCYECIGDLAWHGRRRKHLGADAIADISCRAREELAAARAAKAAAELALMAS